jgi:two-component system, OmpR family, sensor histidine kinase QseC
MKRLIQWFSPTLTRRLLLAVILVDILVLMVVFVKESMLVHSTQNVPLANYTITALYRLDRLFTDQDAIAFADAWGGIFNAYHSGISPLAKNPPLIEVWTLDGRRVYFNQRVPPLPHGVAGKGGKLFINGENYDYFRRDGERWSLRIAVYAYPLHEAMLANLIYYEFYWLPIVSLPILILPLWFAVRRGLQPLRTLVTKLLERKAEDLSPLGFTTHYRELQPLVSTLDSLLVQLNNKVQREYAFLQDAAHELRTPLAVISAQTHVLAKALTPAEQLEASQHIRHAMARTAHLTAQLAELARVDAVSAQDRQVWDIVQLVKLDLAQLAPQALARQIEITLQAPPALQHCLEKNTFQSIFYNFVKNAIIYGYVGGKVMVTLVHEGGDLLLQVADNGPGIDILERELVFERFYRHLGTEVSGSGLGLAIVRQAALRLNAKLELKEGLHGKGCCFSVRIPSAALS